MNADHERLYGTVVVDRFTEVVPLKRGGLGSVARAMRGSMGGEKLRRNTRLHVVERSRSSAMHTGDVSAPGATAGGGMR